MNVEKHPAHPEGDSLPGRLRHFLQASQAVLLLLLSHAKEKLKEPVPCQGHPAAVKSVLLGDCFVVGAQVAAAFQFIIEEKYLTSFQVQQPLTPPVGCCELASAAESAASPGHNKLLAPACAVMRPANGQLRQSDAAGASAAGCGPGGVLGSANLRVCAAAAVGGAGTGGQGAGRPTLSPQGAPSLLLVLWESVLVQGCGTCITS